MRLTFLGTGTSFGIPVIGCECEVCRSDDPRDRRTRHGAVLEWDGFRLLIDTPPELRLQLLANRIDTIDAVWYTHAHADHLHGIDDLRVFSLRSGREVVAYVADEHLAEFRGRFPYIFNPEIRAAEGTSKPLVELRAIAPNRPMTLGGRTATPLPVPHGDTRVYGLRVGRVGYLTDAKTLPPSVIAALQGVDVLVLNALWWGRPHPTHLNVEEAVEVAERVGASTTYLTHLTHRLKHETLADALGPGIEPAHDGLTLEIDD